jgi:hypothetical protein
LSDGGLQVEVAERVMDGPRFRSEVLVSRRIDATADDAVVHGAELFAELRAWADQRNEERRAKMISEESEASLAEVEAAEGERRATAARELAAILERAGT